MATAYRIHVPAQDTGLLKVEQDEATAAKVTELLQRDLEVRPWQQPTRLGIH